MIKDHLKNAMNDLKIELTEEFKKNFARKAFFNQSWPATKMHNRKGSLMMRSGKLRRAIRAQVVGHSIHYTNSMPYATIMNEGGDITVTPQMKKFFWAMYYKAGGAAAGAKGKRRADLSEEAAMWKNMALMKVGQKIKIEARQFIGWHPSLNPKIEATISKHLKAVETEFKKHFKR